MPRVWTSRCGDVTSSGNRTNQENLENTHVLQDSTSPKTTYTSLIPYNQVEKAELCYPDTLKQMLG